VRWSQELDRGLRWGSAPKPAGAKEEEQDYETESVEGHVWSNLWRSLVVLGALAVAAVIFATLMFRTKTE
jgi:hypothetical protein